MIDYINQFRVLIDIFIAAVLGGVIGFERESKNKPAGLRTNMVIAAASALLFSLGNYMVNAVDLNLSDDALSVDPTRILHAIIVGVSFIGAGTILKSSQNHTVKYLTTSAMILFSAGIGISVALHLYILALGLTAIGLIINVLVSKVFDHFN